MSGPGGEARLSRPLEAFCARLGYRFADPALLEQALTHGSASSPARPDNQRLEFLGDRVLGLVIAEALIRELPEAREGELAPRYNALVRRERCAEVAESLGLGEVIRLGRSETRSGGRRKTALLADAMEAVIGAVFLDGGFEAARGVVRRHWAPHIEAVRGSEMRDPKTVLQEWAQARGLPPPSYVETARAGPDHAPSFTIRAELADGRHASATAGSKRKAQQEAARALLARLEDADNENRPAPPGPERTRDA
ncbi:MAG: ribonuclease III [Alphaproteobacteria bacterium]|nr:MAG: ribonuclease III [Alphaproteobacteria bacterium]